MRASSSVANGHNRRRRRSKNASRASMTINVIDRERATYGLKILCGQPRAGSSPALGTRILALPVPATTFAPSGHYALFVFLRCQGFAKKFSIAKTPSKARKAILSCGIGLDFDSSSVALIAQFVQMFASEDEIKSGT
jgi:hypothetical protein